MDHFKICIAFYPVSFICCRVHAGNTRLSDVLDTIQLLKQYTVTCIVLVYQCDHNID